MVKLTPHQIRILQLLYKTGGAMNKARIADELGAVTPVATGWAIGYSNPEKRAAFMMTETGQGAGIPLLELQYVEEIALEVDGKKERGFIITEKGKAAYEELGTVQLRPMRDSYAKKYGRPVPARITPEKKPRSDATVEEFTRITYGDD